MQKLNWYRIGEDDDYDEFDIYSNETRARLVEEDEMSAVEEGFMRGWDEAY
ncbi:hypothetical protein JXB02_01060 [Candidatus Woesearchaeota archaeon]|nr:hypothetical protein [Candidatus Woesearchaeota archaeon]